MQKESFQYAPAAKRGGRVNARPPCAAVRAHEGPTVRRPETGQAVCPRERPRVRRAPAAAGPGRYKRKTSSGLPRACLHRREFRAIMTRAIPRKCWISTDEKPTELNFPRLHDRASIGRKPNACCSTRRRRTTPSDMRGERGGEVEERLDDRSRAVTSMQIARCVAAYRCRLAATGLAP